MSDLEFMDAEMRDTKDQLSRVCSIFYKNYRRANKLNLMIQNHRGLNIPVKELNAYRVELAKLIGELHVDMREKARLKDRIKFIKSKMV